MKYLVVALLSAILPLQAEESTMSPYGITIFYEKDEKNPDVLKAKSLSGDILWEKKPGEEAHISLLWSTSGKILGIITNNQETDRELWTPRSNAQNHLFLIDPRNGEILHEIDLDEKNPQAENPTRPKIEISEEEVIIFPEKGDPQEIQLPPSVKDRINRPFSLKIRRGFSYE